MYYDQEQRNLIYFDGILYFSQIQKAIFKIVLEVVSNEDPRI